MITPPYYFECVRAKAAKRWGQLESDAGLAGPWHQLFKQVQSPRHVLSELLQNADDAEATNAWAKIDNDEFVFEHDGVDFKNTDFESLCEFGYSNKRNLYTIGFRGIGFKSTFSLGDEVRLLTPTLSILYKRNRFTEPVWLRPDAPTKSTQICVQIKDDFRRQELQKNLGEWAKNPLSLLFFRNIKCLTIQDTTVRKFSDGPGPIERSEWVKLSENQERPFLLIRSAAEPFPADALEEIQEERMGEFGFELPPCQIDIVLGLEGRQRLFVVLPTGVDLNLPFSCNAPFVQDPARLKIKEPETSPTNRWLLERVGHLAAEGMIAWLQREDIGLKERCRAYILFPDVDRDDNSLGGICATACEKAFESAITEKEFLITEAGTLVNPGRCITVPGRLYDIWKPDQISSLFDSDRRPLLCRHVAADARQVLVHWKAIGEVNKAAVLNVLESCDIPKPETWRRLLLLWDYVSDEVIKARHSSFYFGPKNVRIVPVQGKEILYPGFKVVRLGEKKILPAKEDWEFLSRFLLVANQNWFRFLTEQRRKAEESDNQLLIKQVQNAQEVLTILNLSEASEVNRILDQVKGKFFSTENLPLTDGVRLAHIAAAFRASVSDGFQYVTRDNQRKPISAQIVADIKSDLDLFVDKQWYEKHVLHDFYWQNFKSCTEAEWHRWANSEASGLLTFVPLQSAGEYIYSRSEACRIAKDHGLRGDPWFHYSTDKFYFHNWDFKKEHWDHWAGLSEEDPEFWGKLMTRILQSTPRQWSRALDANIDHVASNGRTSNTTGGELLPDWIMKFRNLRCLQDTRGWYHEPAELLRRTPDTEALLEVETFVRAEYDTEQTRPLLIKLGVRDTPTGPDRLLERLRAWTKVENPPLYEIEKWYYRLDQLLPKCSTEEVQKIKDMFGAEKLILSDTWKWVGAREVFLDGNEEEVPGAATVHPAVRHLTIWHKIGIPDQPTADLAIGWLRNLPSGKKLATDELRRVRALLSRYAERIWQEIQHWLNLESEWVSTRDLSYKLTMQSLIPWAHLFSAVKRKTADFQHLSAEICAKDPFSELSSLATCVEEQIEEGSLNLQPPHEKEWISVLGKCLTRIILDDEQEQARFREHAQRLAETVWQPAKGLVATPYINGTPAGAPRKIEVLWKSKKLYVENRQVARLFKDIAQELSRPFVRQDITDAIKACVERSPEFISDYLEESFRLIPEETKEPEKAGEEILPSRVIAITGSKDTNQKLEVIEVERPPNKTDETKKLDIKEDEGGDASEYVRHAPKPTKPKFIDIYAKACGYEQGSDPDCFIHPDGSRLRKSDGGPFPWQKYTAEGQLLQSYWLKEHCLKKEPLQLGADVWSLCLKAPNRYTLVLTDPEGNPMELSGENLGKLVESGRLKLYPAEYRLAYEEEHE